MKKTVIEPNLSYLLEQLKENIINNLNCIKIGKIETFYSEDKTADINICFKKKENEEIKDYPLLLKCPVICNHITYPIKKGEYCLVLFNDVNLDGWFENSENQVPYTLEKHCISDGICIVGLNNLVNKITDYETNRIDLTENTVISGELEVEKDATFDKNITININLTVQGNTKINGTLEANGISDLTAYTGTIVDTGAGATGLTWTVKNGIVIKQS